MTRQIFGYARVSSTDQNLERQLALLREYVTDERYIFADKASGKDFDRKAYNLLVGTLNNSPMLRQGDLLVICSIDRLGRNYNAIREQWQLITQTIGADIKVLDMPLLDTSTNLNSLDGRFIAELVLQILSYTAEKERESIRIRQRQGIDVMPLINGKRVSIKTHKAVGRPNASYPDQWEPVYKEWKKGIVTAVEAMKKLEMKKTTFYKLVQQWEVTHREKGT